MDGKKARIGACLLVGDIEKGAVLQIPTDSSERKKFM